MTTAHSTVKKQLGLGSNLSTRKTRKARFVDEMERVVPWAALVKIVEPYCPRAKTGCPPFAVETTLQIHYLQQWLCLCDSSMEEALHDTSLFREFVQIGRGVMRLPGETTSRQSCGSDTCWSSTTWRRPCRAWSTTSWASSRLRTSATHQGRQLTTDFVLGARQSKGEPSY